MPNKGQPLTINPSVAKNYLIIEEAYFAGHFHEQYGHLLTELISRLWAYKQYNLKMPIIVRMVSRTLDSLFDHSWVKELMNLLGLEKSDFLVPTTPIRIKNLTIPDPLFAEQGYCYKAMADFCHQLGDKAMVSLDQNSLIKNSNIYLSRSKLQCGTIKLEKEHLLNEKFKELGFVVVHPQDYSIKEQISFFRNNNIVVGIVGSAFHTSIFSRSPQGVAINLKKYPDINFLTMDGINNASIEYISHSGIVPSSNSDKLFYETKEISDIEEFSIDLYNFVKQKRSLFSIANMGKTSVTYKPDITFQKILCKQDNQEKIVKIDSRTGNVSTKSDDFFYDLLLVCLKVKEQNSRYFLIANADIPLTIRYDPVTAPVIPVEVKKDGENISLYINSSNTYFVSVNNNRINYENYTLLDFDYAKEKKEGLTTLCSILTLVFDVNSYSNMEYYNNIYPELVNSIFDIKNSIHRNIILTYSQSNHNFIPLIPVEVKELLKGKIILHKSGIGDLHIKGNIDTGKSYNTAIESINIELDQNNKLYNMVYSVKVGNQEWSRWFKEGEDAGTKGQSQAIIGLDINIFDQDQNDIPCICYAQFENDKVIYKYNGGTLFTSPTKRNLVNFAICLSDK